MEEDGSILVTDASLDSYFPLFLFPSSSSKWTRQCQDLGGRRESEKLIKKRERLEGGDEITRETR